jgi:hypothetical protein
VNYPSDFDVPTFPAGRKIVSSRLMGIVSMLMFVLTLLTCGLILWSQKSIREQPFLVFVNRITGQWNVVEQQDNDIVDRTAAQLMQEALLTRFVEYWFWVSSSSEVNNARWKSCNRSVDCDFNAEKSGIDIDGVCALYCMAGDDLYNAFTQNVLPLYQELTHTHTTWQINPDTLKLFPLTNVNENGGMWQVLIQVSQNGKKPMNILGYARIEKSNIGFNKTLGYYVSKFYTYKMD